MTTLLSLSCILWCCGCSEKPRCNDGIQNGDETEVDCGGSCPDCYTCDDGFQNQDEVGIDCGGPCTPCPDQWQIWSYTPRLNEMQFTDANHAYGFTAPNLYKTVNGGRDWIQISTPSDQAYQMMPVSANRCFVRTLGAESELYVTQNGGNNWEKCNIPQLNNFTHQVSISFFNDQQGVMLLRSTFDIDAFRTTDGGLTWEKKFTLSEVQPSPYPSGEDVTIRSLKAFPSGKVVGMGYRVRLVSTDFGQTWSPLINPTAGTRLDNSVYWIDENNGYMLGENNMLNDQDIQSYTTSNGGVTWVAFDNIGDQNDNGSLQLPLSIVPQGPDTLLYLYRVPRRQLEPTAHPLSFSATNSLLWFKTRTSSIRPLGRIAYNIYGSYTYQVFPGVCIFYNLDGQQLFRLEW